MYANVTAEASGRTLAVRLYNMTSDAGMRDMLAFLIARDTMHQQQWLAVIEELGAPADQLPIPNSFPQAQEHQRFSYTFVDPRVGDAAPLTGRFAEGPSLDGKGEFSVAMAEPYGQEPQLAPPPPAGGAQTEQMGGEGLIDRVKSALR
jgi:Mn-containing catalase